MLQWFTVLGKHEVRLLSPMTDLQNLLFRSVVTAYFRVRWTYDSEMQSLLLVPSLANW